MAICIWIALLMNFDSSNMQMLSIQNYTCQIFQREYYESWVWSEWIWIDHWHVATQKPIFEPPTREGGVDLRRVFLNYG